MPGIRIVIITGAARGLGLTLAKEFAANGWQVAGTGRSAQPVGWPKGASYHQFDASNWAECELFWQKLYKEYAHAEFCLVNNAGGYINGSLTKTTPQNYEQQMKSIYFSSVYMTRGLALVVPKARVINVISAGALTANKNDSAYGAAKAAQMHFFKALQEEFTPEQYQITNLYPNNIASRGPTPNAMTPQDLASFIRQQAENSATYYLRDVTIYPR